MTQDKDLERLIEIIINSDLYQTFIGQNVDYSSTEKKLAQAILKEYISLDEHEDAIIQLQKDAMEEMKGMVKRSEVKNIKD